MIQGVQDKKDSDILTESKRNAWWNEKIYYFGQGCHTAAYFQYTALVTCGHQCAESCPECWQPMRSTPPPPVSTITLELIVEKESRLGRWGETVVQFWRGTLTDCLEISWSRQPDQCQ